jgi:transitional endoplasmic reticulum ATPase
LRRPGRFDREIEIGVPNEKGRKEVMQIHTRGMPLSKEGKEKVDLKYYASITHGFVGADIAALAKEAAMKSLRRYLPKINLEEEKIPPEVLESLEVNKKDFNDALKDIQPSALREVAIEVPNTHWKDIGALEKVKEELKKVVQWPLQNPEAFKKMGIKPPKGVLLYGQPGCGKTLLVKAVATESNANFISIKGPELMSKWVGESERGIRKVFRRARQVSPVIVFFDEIDSIASVKGNSTGSGTGDRMVDQLLTELDGIEDLKDVIFVAATNRPDLIDPGLLRPGRIDKLIHVGAPETKAREEILKVHVKNVPLEKDVDLKNLAEKTKGFSGADLFGLVMEAVMIRLKENKMDKGNVSMKDFEEALKKINPSVADESEEAYENFREEVTKFKPSYVG